MSMPIATDLHPAPHEPRLAAVRRPEDARTRELYQEIVDTGFGAELPINWFTVQGARPDLLEATWGLVKGVLVNGLLPPTVKQMICTAISVQNDCRYCAVTHTGALEAMGVPQDVISACVNDIHAAPLPRAQKAVLSFAVKAARAPNSVTDEDYAALREHGLTQAEIMEVAMTAAFTNFINTWADVTGIEVDGK